MISQKEKRGKAKSKYNKNDSWNAGQELDNVSLLKSLSENLSRRYS